MDAENKKESCSQRDSAEPDLFGKILDRDHLNRACKRVKANKGAPGVDGMTI